MSRYVAGEILSCFEMFIKGMNVVVEIVWVFDWGPICVVKNLRSVSPNSSNSEDDVSNNDPLGLGTPFEWFHPRGSH